MSGDLCAWARVLAVLWRAEQFAGCPTSLSPLACEMPLLTRASGGRHRGGRKVLLRAPSFPSAEHTSGALNDSWSP